MAFPSGDTPLINPTNVNKPDDQSSIPAFPNSRWMNSTTNLSRNPGVFDDVFKKIKGLIFIEFDQHFAISSSLDLMPPTFEGAKLSVTKILSSHFQVTHSLTLNSGASCGYKFGANYVGTQMYSQSDVNFLLEICPVK